MSKYIDADRIRTEIERQIAFLPTVGYSTQVASEFIPVQNTLNYILSFIDSLQQETSEINLERFIEKMEDWKARYNYPDNIPIKATMAFTARMFYMYPNVARQWYDSLPKVIQD